MRDKKLITYCSVKSRKQGYEISADIIKRLHALIIADKRTASFTLWVE